MTYTQTKRKVVSDDGFLVREEVFVRMGLKRCPFCGGKPKTQHTTNDKQEDLIFVECSNCEAASGEFLSHEEAATAWNRRA
jgi:Lar family restriction alleviation protein